MKRVISFVTRLIVIVLIVGVMTGGLSNAINAAYYNGIIRDQIHKENALMLQHIYDEVNIQLVAIERDVEMLSIMTRDRFANVWAGSLDMNMEEAFYEKYFLDYLHDDISSALSVYIYFDPSIDGDVHDVWMNSQDGENFVREDEVPLERYINHDNMDWFYGPKALGVGTWIPPYRNRYDQHITSYVAPIYVDDEFVGIVGMYLALESMKGQVKSLLKGLDGQVIITNAHHEIIYGEGVSEGDKWSDYHEQVDMFENFDVIDYQGETYYQYVIISEFGWRYLYLVPTAGIGLRVLTSLTTTFAVYAIAILLFVFIVWLFLKRYKVSLREMLYNLSLIRKQKLDPDSHLEMEDDGRDETIKALEKRIRMLEAKNEELHYSNDMSGIKNEKRLREFMASVENDQASVSLVRIAFENVDQLDTLMSHKTVGEVIKKISNKLVGYTANGIRLFHVAKYEFVYTFEDVKDETLRDFVDRMSEELKECFVFHQNDVSASLSISVVLESQVMTTDILTASEIALNEARRIGINQVVYYDEVLYQALTEEYKLISELKNSLGKKWFLLEYMPEISIEKQEIVAVEALVRLKHPRLGWVEPRTFIPYADKHHLMGEISEYILDAACKQFKDWKVSKCKITHLALNLSMDRLSDPELIEKTLKITGKHGIRPSDIDFGVTLRILDDEKIVENIKRLIEAGFGVTLDDFGKDMHALEMMKDIPFSRVKLDMSLISKVDASEEHQLVVESLIKIANSMGLPVLAEGVENAEQVEWLIKAGCKIAQGYFFAKPMSPKAIADYCDRYSHHD